MKILHVVYSLVLGLGAGVSAIGQIPTLSFDADGDGLRIGGDGITPILKLDSADWAGVIRAANDVATDFGRVTNTSGKVDTSDGSSAPSTGPIIIVGTIGKSSLIDSLVSAGKIDVSAVKGKWEAFTSQVVESPLPDAPGVTSALVIAGSDKRGTIYGLYDISEQIGVSPWYWWADVPPKKRTDIFALSNVKKIQGPPSVKYRGIFLNDEQPALTNWVNANYPKAPTGMPGFNADFHAKVFELLLRLRANYFWPVMWNNMFYLDDTKNGPLADMYGIVMGTSHTEPMARADKEKSRYNSGSWDWKSNQKNVKQYMQDGLTRAKGWDTLWTMGMRGDGDNASPTLDKNQLMDVINYQQSILQTTFGNLSAVPQMWCLYKEVAGYYQQGMSVPPEVTLLWSDDNVGNVQRLPVPAEQARVGGAGVYYHFDYVGSPRNYKWINSIQLSKTWEQMYLSYEKGARQIWIVNVGDLKALELPISHFLDMAYDITQHTASDSTDKWLKLWATREFGASVADGTAAAMATYGKLIVRRKYELLNTNFLSTTNYDEAETVLAEWTALAKNTQALYDTLDAATQNAFFEMILHPTLAGKTVLEVYIKAALNALYVKQKRMTANVMASGAKTAYSADQALSTRYHSLLNGKWNHMMDQIHFGYSSWQDPSSGSMPAVSTVSNSAPSSGIMGISVQGSANSAPGDAVPPMISVNPYLSEKRYIDIYARGDGSFTYSIVSNASYVTVSSSTGTITSPNGPIDARVSINIDWAAAPQGLSQVALAISRAGVSGSTTLILPVNKFSVPSGFTGFVESVGLISMEAGHFTSRTSTSTASYAVIPNYGRTNNGIIIMPVTAPSLTTSSGPKLSYSFYSVTTSSSAKLTVYLSPSFNVNPEKPFKYAFSIDNGNPTTVQPVPSASLGSMPGGWDESVTNGARTVSSTLGNVPAGKHVLDLWMLEPGIVVEKLVIDLGGVKSSYLGPPESAQV